MRLYLCRFSFIENAQPELGEEFSLPERRDFISRFLGKKFEFFAARGQQFSYYPIQTEGNFIYGSVNRWHSETTESNPEDPFQPVEGGHWEHATFVFNAHPDQQVFGVEHNQKVGRPLAIAKNIARSLDDRSERRQYSTQVFSINSQQGFWAAIEEFEGTVTSLEFNLTMPNPTGIGDETKRVLKQIGHETRAQNLKETLSNPDGMELDSDHVRDRVKYVEDGGGDVSAKSGKVGVFDSAKNQKVADVDDSLRVDGRDRGGLSEELNDKLVR